MKSCVLSCKLMAKTLFLPFIYITAFWGLKREKKKKANFKNRFQSASAKYHYSLCLKYKNVLSVSLQSDVANYWLGMHNSIFIVIFVDPCEKCKKKKQVIFFSRTLSM